MKALSLHNFQSKFCTSYGLKNKRAVGCADVKVPGRRWLFKENGSERQTELSLCWETAGG